MAQVQTVIDSYKYIINYFKAIGYNSAIDEENFKNTGFRATDALTELITPLPQIKSELQSILSKTFPVNK